MAPITPYLWFASEAEEAAVFYVSIFPDSSVGRIMRYPADAPGVSATSVATVEFTLGGRPFVAMNGGSAVERTHAVSLSYECADQAEIDRVWTALMAGGGKPIECGWLTDRHGFAWQIVPRQLLGWMGDPDRLRAARVMRAMQGMVKLDLSGLRAAYDG